MIQLMIQAENLTYQREHKILFRNLTFSVAAGTCLLVTGPNGSGKTSLLKILMDLITPDNGMVKRNAPMIYIGHQPGFKRSLTLRENLEWLRDIHFEYNPRTEDNPCTENNSCAKDNPRTGEHSTGEKETIAQALTAFHLKKQMDLPCSHLSTGQLQKASLARLRMCKVPLWILDEPFNSLDAEAISIFEQMALEHLENDGALIVATHIGFSSTKLAGAKLGGAKLAGAKLADANVDVKELKLNGGVAIYGGAAI